MANRLINRMNIVLPVMVINSVYGCLYSMAWYRSEGEDHRSPHGCIIIDACERGSSLLGGQCAVVVTSQIAEIVIIIEPGLNMVLFPK